jgi:hypothetical protein
MKENNSREAENIGKCHHDNDLSSKELESLTV